MSRRGSHANAQSSRLHHHPSTPTAAARSVAVALRWDRAMLAVSFILEGNLNAIRIPAPGVPRMAKRLWEHTCFELFVGVTGDLAYHELNFSPSGEWAAHAFRGYRDGGPLGDAALAPRIAARAAGDRLTVDARVDLDRLDPAYRRSALRVGLSAVVEETSGARSYWALAHPPGEPDFHHPDAFQLMLETGR
jgi:hypothetical protein